jgi:predicted PurR-regulated permease PerM
VILATSFLTFLWSLIVIFFMVVYFIMLFTVVIDVFRRRDTSGGKKALWLIFLFFFPFVGLIVYLIVNGDGIAQRHADSNQKAQQDFDSYVRDVSGGSADQIAKAKGLLDSGAITQAEFDKLKAQALA